MPEATILFNSLQCLYFFVAVFTTYWAMPRPRIRVGLFLAGAGYYALKAGHIAALAGSAFGQNHGSALDYLHHSVTSFLASTTWDLWLPAIICASVLVAFRSGHDRARVWLLVLASFCFYASWNGWLALLICVSTTMDYFVALGMEATPSRRLRRLLLVLSLVANLGLLAYFKYANFFLHSLEEALHAAGAMASLPVLQVILPVGISFYTFEAINYTVDVYMGRAPAERNLAHFMLFITFFPHLVAGPIVRARDFLPQIRRRKHWDWARLQLGVQFFLMGFFKKVIADRMAYWADPVFKEPDQYGSYGVWVATVAYAVQIFCDFSGYSDMALGTAHMLGYKLAQNFNLPYIAANIAEFWHRWHMSLSTWLRDYLFIPLGGSRGSEWQTCRNLMITMLLGGLWHMQYDPKLTNGGLGWTFIVWGGLHGLLLIGHRLFHGFCKVRPRLDALLQSLPGTGLRIATTVFCVGLCWVFFRATSFEAAGEIFHRLFVPHAGRGCPPTAPSTNSMWIMVLLVAVCHVVGYYGLWKKLSVRLPAPALGFSYAMMLTLALLLAPESGQTFIYFQF